MNVWDGINLTEPKKNCSSFKELDRNDTTISTRNDLTKNKCDDTGLTRSCPKCKDEIRYTNKWNRNTAEKHKRLCKRCISDGYMKYSLLEKLERNCPKCGCLVTYNGKNKRVAFHHHRRACLENRICNKCIRSGENNGAYGLHRFGKENPNYGTKWGIKQKDKARKFWSSKYVERGYQFHNYNPNACKYFNTLSEERGWNLQHAENGGEVLVEGYFLDAYDKKNNVVVEYDEPHHFVGGKLRKKDIDRMKKLIHHMGCKFYRYNVLDNKLYECN